MYPVMRVGTHAPHVVQYIEDLLKYVFNYD